MLTLMFLEMLKLRRSLALALCIVAPLSVVVMCLLMVATRETALPWKTYLGEGVALWVYFMLPMSVTALSVLLAQVEHGPRMWGHLLALPVRRAELFLAKGFVAFLLACAMTAGLAVLLFGAGWAWGALTPKFALTGEPPVLAIAKGLSIAMAASVAMVVLQVWAALRYRSFVPGFVLGILGTFGALAVTASRQFVLFPWLLGAFAMRPDAPVADLALAWGFYGGLGLLLAMCWDLSRRERLVMA
jgi:ABC-2 type transport system permease protein